MQREEATLRIPDELHPLFDYGIVQEVVRPLMAGKEAAAWIVESEGELRCAKVYKQAHNRSFHNRSEYTEGRRTRNTRDARARAKKSRYGRRQEEEAWQNTEVDALHKLSAAGVRVPKPHLFMEGVLIMDLVTDHLGNPAPRLIDVGLTAEQARLMMQFMAQQSVRMLLAGVVHGDLSEYNVLIAEDGPVIIDLPQAVDAAANRNAQKIFERDLKHLAEYLSRFAPDLARTRYGREIWRLYERGKLHEDVELTGQSAPERRPRVDGRALRREIRVVEAADEEEGGRGGSGGGRRRRKRRKRGGGGQGGGGQGGGDGSRAGQQGGGQRSDGQRSGDRSRGRGGGGGSQQAASEKSSPSGGSGGDGRRRSGRRRRRGGRRRGGGETRGGGNSSGGGNGG